MTRRFSSGSGVGATPGDVCTWGLCPPSDTEQVFDQMDHFLGELGLAAAPNRRVLVGLSWRTRSFLRRRSSWASQPAAMASQVLRALFPDSSPSGALLRPGCFSADPRPVLGLCGGEEVGPVGLGLDRFGVRAALDGLDDLEAN